MLVEDLEGNGGEKVKVLFVCTGNTDRSRTAQEMFDSVKRVEAKSAGTSPEAPVRLSIKLIRWADKIFCMEPRHQVAVLQLDPGAQGKIVVLNIPDLYVYAEPRLKRLLGRKISLQSAKDQIKR
ncbi:MAG: phosphotyrosine protein phosphatase [Candidatus Bathyarchaeota archaeon]|nr:phosphotyrosine protein phosphatase [Candidatus Bathyarchaeota archaeon]